MKKPNDIKTMTSYVELNETMDPESFRKEVADPMGVMFSREIVRAAVDPGKPGKYRLRVMYTLEFEKVR